MNRGFSLLELMITTAMVSALTAVAVPSICAWRERHVVVHETKRLQRALERAYTIALLRENTVVVALAQDSITAKTKDNLPLFSFSPHRGITIQLKSKEQQNLLFYPSHTTTPATVLIAGPRFSCSVVISLRGRTRRECA